MLIAALLLTQLHLQYSYFYKGDHTLTKSLKEAIALPSGDEVNVGDRTFDDGIDVGDRTLSNCVQ
ncbi:hypothetical protein LC607_30305 [Nostoc sp. CHAB 5824]|nr:hypothetical protein [Nostoc sp. CHAB 5824]